MAIEACRHLAAIAERENISVRPQRAGILHIYNDRVSYEAAERVNTLLRIGGLDRRPVPLEEIRKIEPTLHGEYYGGFFTESDVDRRHSQVHPGLADAQRRGAVFSHEADVRRIEAAGKRFPVT